MAEENRRAIVADALRPHLEDGERYTVFCEEGEVYVSEAETSVCSVLHPRLYGRLLSLNTQLDEAGAGLGRLPMLLVLGFSVGLHLHLLDDWLGPRVVDRIDSVWFYILLFFGVFQVLQVSRNAL